jgi:septal ring factor EnvC (AmiA/AmiB activator)
VTTKANGCFEIKASTLYATVAIISILSAVVGMAVAWGAQNSSIALHHADKGIHLTQKDVEQMAPTKQEYEATLKRLDTSLTTIDARLQRIEDKVYGR